MRLLGLDFADMSAADAAALLAQRPASAPFDYVTTPNADHLVRLHRGPELRPLYEGAMLRLLDSRVVALAAWLLGLPTPQVAPGSDLTALLLARHVRSDERITIVGLSSEWLAPLVARCRLAVPAHFDPPRGFERDPAMLRAAVDFVLAHPARFTFFAVGSPRQEILAAAVKATGRASGVGLCIGASLKFVAGAEKRAPAWMQSHSLEWLHRLSQHPVRLARRYLVDSPAILPMLLRERFATDG
ncbi:MAG TPA: WecB/TagA/CpsF family glycosyltransferase [Acetobacteraceae bacterium]|nr:WecB/TagA/CpsF family glycosyltransferase [Acetobacteraceae bacterium]